MAVVKSLSYLDEKVAPMVDRIIDIWDNLSDAKTLDNLHTAIGIPPVLVHGDLWIGNVIWKQRVGKRTLAAIVDWQRRTLARNICCALTAKDRREHWRDILEYYYRKLGEKMRKEPPLSFNQVTKRYPERVDELVAVMREKAIGLLEDILDYYALNTEKNA
ncbi:unnamed protein product [Toxocara canis]|uniref:CHK domain-containing protein n=1 Tax=Toxocara canis TaxID=6265 RepID=A0A183TZU2_TOXCA|nr:unnamed protein product [Toxocara canis]